jgi:putative transposase
MPQSLVKNINHIVFSTKDRLPIIPHEIAPTLYRYIGGICTKLKCNPIKIGGHLNHVHILCLVSKDVTISKLLEQMKSGSSKWLRTQEQHKDFQWQVGYASFSVSQWDVGKVTTYIHNQHIHHKRITYEEELLQALKENGVAYDEKYLWD